MKRKYFLASTLGGLLLGVSIPGMAHHGQVGLFDTTRTIEVRGAVKEWSFVNPHPVLTLEVVDAGGARVEWEVYFGPSAVAPLRKRGFSAGTFKIGETIVVTGHPATTAAHGVDVWGAGTSVARADGGAIP